MIVPAAHRHSAELVGSEAPATCAMSRGCDASWRRRFRASAVRGSDASSTACDIRVRGVVQGVGFRPFVFRLAQANTLAGWVLNDENGVEIHLEGSRTRARRVCSFARRGASAGREHRQHRRSRRPSRLDSRSSPFARAACADVPACAHLARPAGLRRLPRGTVRSRRIHVIAIRTSTAPIAARAIR